jgi:hypothetical protein
MGNDNTPLKRMQKRQYYKKSKSELLNWKRQQRKYTYIFNRLYRKTVYYSLNKWNYNSIPRDPK